MKTTKHPLMIGWAQVDITPDRPVYLAGQIYRRVSRYVHDPITATALVLENGGEQATFVSLDMVGIPSDAIASALRQLSLLPGFDPKKASFNATHTHSSSMFGEGSGEDADPTEGAAKPQSRGEDPIPFAIQPKLDVPDDIFAGAEAREWLADKLAALITDAWTGRAPGAVAFAQDYAAVAFNRRPLFAMPDGTTEARMYGTCSDDNFVGLEGASDHTADMMYTFDNANRLTGVLVDIPCPSQVTELHYFISADYWTPTRRQIREKLGESLYVLPMCGAAGDQNPLDLIRISKHNREELREWNAQAGAVFRNLDMGLECEDIGARIAEAVARGYGKAASNRNSHAALDHRVLTLRLPVRRVTEEDYLAAKAELAGMAARFTPEQPMAWTDWVAAFNPLGVVGRWELQNEHPDFECVVHVLRVGDTLFATDPFELFVEFGMRLKARSPSAQTVLCQLANGHGGYLPTQRAVEGGSYSSKPSSTTVGPDSGTLLVEETLRVMREMWKA